MDSFDEYEEYDVYNGSMASPDNNLWIPVTNMVMMLLLIIMCSGDGYYLPPHNYK